MFHLFGLHERSWSYSSAELDQKSGNRAWWIGNEAVRNQVSGKSYGYWSLLEPCKKAQNTPIF